MRKPIVVVGSVNLDLTVSVARLPVPGETVTGSVFRTFFGGKGANQAVGVARLNYPVSIIAKVGDDDIGKRLRMGLRGAGVGTRAVGVAKRTSSGIALITTVTGGQNSIVVVPGANGELLPADVRAHETLIKNAGMILTQIEMPLETLICTASVARRHGVPVMLDPAPARDLPLELLRQITWLTPNETESCLMCGLPAGSITPENVVRHAEELLRRGPENVVIKMGEQGSYLANKSGQRCLVPAFRVPTVDSTAAGDAFNAGLAVALMRGEGLEKAMRFASAAAALSVTKQGAQSSMASARDVMRFLRNPKSASPRRGMREQPNTRKTASLISKGEVGSWEKM